MCTLNFPTLKVQKAMNSTIAKMYELPGKKPSARDWNLKFKWTLGWSHRHWRVKHLCVWQHWHTLPTNTFTPPANNVMDFYNMQQQIAAPTMKKVFFASWKENWLHYIWHGVLFCRCLYEIFVIYTFVCHRANSECCMRGKSYSFMCGADKTGNSSEIH